MSTSFTPIGKSIWFLNLSTHVCKFARDLVYKIIPYLRMPYLQISLTHNFYIRKNIYNFYICCKFLIPRNNCFGHVKIRIKLLESIVLSKTGSLWYIY